MEQPLTQLNIWGKGHKLALLTGAYRVGLVVPGNSLWATTASILNPVALVETVLHHGPLFNCPHLQERTSVFLQSP